VKSHFGSDPNIIGKIVRIDKRPYTIVGVTPESFYGTQKSSRPISSFPWRTRA